MHKINLHGFFLGDHEGIGGKKIGEKLAMDLRKERYK